MSTEIKTPVDYMREQVFQETSVYPEVNQLDNGVLNRFLEALRISCTQDYDDDGDYVYALEDMEAVYECVIEEMEGEAA